MPAGRVRFLVLGAGITGLTAAWELSKRFAGDVVALDKSTATGGLAGTFTRGGLAFDYGSHRLHDGYDPAAGALIQSLCGEELLWRERRGRLCLGERAIPYPPSAFDVATAFGFRDLLRVRIVKGSDHTESSSADLQQMIKRVVGPNMRLELEYLSKEDLQRDCPGKFRAIVSRLGTVSEPDAVGLM